MVAGSHANVNGGAVGQVSGAPLVVPLTTIAICDPGLLVITAVPATVQLPVGNGLMKEPVAELVTMELVVMVLAVVKVMEPGVTVVEAPHVTEKLKSIV
jgi:hypothetical protein